MKIKINKPGLFTTVQDLGRFGYQQFGMPVAGVMDSVSARLANLLVGNEEDQGLMEVTLMGPEIEFLDSSVISITGGDLLPTLNHQPLPMYKSIPVKKGDLLGFQGMKKGCRSYIAFAGGLDLPVIMGSQSTYTRGQVGGHEGRVLQAGDILPLGQPQDPLPELAGKEIQERFYEYPTEVEVRVILGPQEGAFTPQGLSTFFSSSYTVSSQSDRMGYSLQGEAIEHKGEADIISDGICMGAIQVPGHGHPIIMMADRQTTGGYTKIGNVISVDLPKVAQAKPGDIITFKEIELEEAHRLLKELEEKITSIKNELASFQSKTTRPSRKFHIKVNGKSFEVTVDECKD